MQFEDVHIAFLQHPRGMRTKLRGRQLPTANPFEHSCLSNIQYGGGLLYRQRRTTAPLAGNIHLDVMTVSKAANSSGRLAFPMGRAISVAVKDGSDHRVELLTCKPANQFDRVRIADETVLSRAHLFEANGRVVAAAPMQEQLHLRPVGGCYNFQQHRAQNAFFELRQLCG